MKRMIWLLFLWFNQAVNAVDARSCQATLRHSGQFLDHEGLLMLSESQQGSGYFETLHEPKQKFKLGTEVIAPKHAQNSFGGTFYESIETVNYEPSQGNQLSSLLPETYLKNKGEKYSENQLIALMHEIYDGSSTPLTGEAIVYLVKTMIGKVEFHDSTAEEVRKLRKRKIEVAQAQQTKYTNHRGFRLSLGGDHQFFVLRSNTSVFDGRVLGILNNFTSSNAKHLRLMSILVELSDRITGHRSLVTLTDYELANLSQFPEDISQAKMKFENDLTKQNHDNLQLVKDVLPLKWPHSPYFGSIDPLLLTSELPTKWSTTNDEGYQIETFASVPSDILEHWDQTRYYYWFLDLDGNFRISPGPNLYSDLPENHLALLSNYKPAYIGGYVEKRVDGNFFVLIDNEIYSFLPESEKNRYGQVADKVNEIFNLNLGINIDEVGVQSSRPPRHIIQKQ